MPHPHAGLTPEVHSSNLADLLDRIERLERRVGIIPSAPITDVPADTIILTRDRMREIGRKGGQATAARWKRAQAALAVQEAAEAEEAVR